MTRHFQQYRAIWRTLGATAACAALAAFAAPVAAGSGYVPPPGGSVRDGYRHDDDGGAIDMGNVAMAQLSQYPLSTVSGSIVSLSAAPGRAGTAVITATGQLCTSHAAGVADSATLQITVDGAMAPGGSQSFTIPAAQAAGQVCSPFTISSTFNAFSEQAHYISLDGLASSATAYVSGASLSAVLYPYRNRPYHGPR